MADQAAMSERRQARPKRDASVSGDDPTYYVEKYESRWRVTYEGAPIAYSTRHGMPRASLATLRECKHSLVG